MLHYDDLESHIILPSLSLVSCLKTLEVFKSSLCKSAWSQRGRWKILLGVNHDVQVEVYNYLKEKLRSWKYVVCVTASKMLLMVLQRTRDISVYIWYKKVPCMKESSMVFVWKHSSGTECFSSVTAGMGNHCVNVQMDTSILENHQVLVLNCSLRLCALCTHQHSRENWSFFFTYHIIVFSLFSRI